MSIGTMSQFHVDFDESDGLFDSNVEEFNTSPGMSTVSNTSG